MKSEELMSVCLYDYIKIQIYQAFGKQILALFSTEDCQNTVIDRNQRERQRVLDNIRYCSIRDWLVFSNQRFYSIFLSP